MRFLSILFFLTIINFNIFANNIATVNIDFIFQNSIFYTKYLKEIEIITKKKSLIFNNIEKSLEDEQIKLKSMKNIVNDLEFNNLSNNFNEKLNIFKSKVDDFNNLISQNIDENKKILFDNIVIILKNISVEDNFDVILNKDNYIISNSNIDISNKVIDLLNIKNLQFNLDNIEDLI